ncbi:MAG: hypothetical protein DWB56_16385 [Candidatus Jettenia sp.]|uniref:Uncharacterized protein n=2 Tax=Candidatus Jettenia TaxID=360731 RepID=I3IR18_9BACT|nr:hypothetical protein [Candidatus Jettenia sp. AMX1]MBC6930498.1 hypothetical protein [Candidatus Jettenia sp.]NUN24680.1 hypothetical protein [Candidatus Jettenia caeni]TLD42586.1 MAG: hypothetical protein JETT_1142 [Candidatus Jettenia ecosi]KAA0247007.1 MAG: hypothetical protein EDM77_15985 [Candidatus Jettenia sp. AMX1]MCE7879743.1 hypothetical protein [Candidatus Jettenia sp. AMX1]
MDIKLLKYFMLKPKTAIEIDPEIFEALKQITAKNPRLSVNLLIDVGLDYISNLKEEDLLKLITEYYGRKHTPRTSI